MKHALIHLAGVCGLLVPLVVGCGNATALLRTGDRVRVNGARGTVERVGQRRPEPGPDSNPVA